MNIVLLFPHYNTLEQASSLRSWQIGRYLADQGHDVTAFAPGVDLRSGKLFPEVNGKLYAKYEMEGVKLIRPISLPSFRRSALHRFIFEIIYAFLSSVYALTIRPVDIIVVSYPPAVVPFFGYGVAKLLGVPVVFEMRDLMADALIATGYVRSELFYKIAKWAENFVAFKSDYIITVSEGIKEAIISDGVDGRKIDVVSNGYENVVFENAQYTWNPREKFEWGDRTVVIYAGGLTQAYDIPTLLKSANVLRENKGIQFVIVGEGEKKDEYINYCNKNELSSVQFIDYQPRKHMPVFFKYADIGVHLFPDDPLWDYVLGNKTFDYLGSGLPMIYAGRGDTANLIRESGAGIVVDPEDYKALANKILYLKNNPQIRRSMGKKGKKYVQEHYNRKKLLKKFERILLDVEREKQRGKNGN